GLIYLASQEVDTPVGEDSNFLIKVVNTGMADVCSRLFYPFSLTFALFRYRFMAMDRLVSDLQKVCERNDDKLKKHTVLHTLDVLEYIHDNEYSPDGVHKENKGNPKKGHKGTVEYTNIDAQNGVALDVGRGNLEVLGFCLLHWLCWALPWEAKTRLMCNLPDSVQQLSVGGASTSITAASLLGQNCSSSFMLDGFRWCTAIFKSYHRISIGLRSGPFQDI
uniref:Uncharacterized protein n=1 Tax=Oncorhynchus tshawytscha TaxID=74940 RepID=A0A8C8GHK0_ONCTS